MKLDAFDYSLPAEKIATKPADPRESARLLDLSGDDIADRHIGDMPELFLAEERLL